MRRVLSLGWGVQSFALAAMSALGVLPLVDAAIHADTGFERRATLEFARRWTPWLEEHGIPVVTVKADSSPSVFNNHGGVTIPAFTAGEGVWGQLRRQCTDDWKLTPIRRWLREHAGGEQVELWLGITQDERRRARPADVQYIVHRWPFLEPELWEGRVWRRWQVKRWLEEHLGPEGVPVRSACVVCPYQSREDWRWLRDNEPENWQRAVEVDRAIRRARPPFDLFLSDERVPLEEVDLSTPEERGQMPLTLTWRGANA